MHLMTFIEIARPNWVERILILGAQGVFFIGFFLLYVVSGRTAHWRVTGNGSFRSTISFLWARESVRACFLKNHFFGRLTDFRVQFLNCLSRVLGFLGALTNCISRAVEEPRCSPSNLSILHL